MKIDLERLIHDDPGLRQGEFGLLVAVTLSALKDHDWGFFNNETMFLLLCRWLSVSPEAIRQRLF